MRVTLPTILWLCAPAMIASASEPQVISTPAFEMDYTVSAGGAPLTEVVLWSTLDNGKTWQPLAYDTDRRSPIVVEVPEEGVFGLYLVASNAQGPSSMKPGPSTRPHLHVFVDYTPPIVQLHEPRLFQSLGRHLVQVRWSAADAHLGQRPIQLRYRPANATDWQTIEGGPFANTGRFDWRAPEGLAGVLYIQATVTDQAGHSVSSEVQAIEIPRPQTERALIPPPGRPAVQANGTLAAFEEPTPRSAYPAPGVEGMVQFRPAAGVTGSSRSREQASKLHAEAMALRDAGDYRLAIAKLRETIRLDPSAVDAIVEMADLLYRLGDYEQALAAYNLGLDQAPDKRAALRGAAMIYSQRRDYDAAARSLRSILRYNPNDAEVWMNLGDVAIFQGDEALARECYTRASQVSPAATAIVAEAQKRLSIMRQASRRYEKGQP